MNYKVTKVKIKDRSLAVDMNETISGDDYSFTNEVTKKCASLVHDDLITALKSLVPHMVKICDFAGSDIIKESNIESAFTLAEEFPQYEITGFSIGGIDDNEGVTLIGQRKFDSGKVLNIVTPFIKYTDEDYKFGDELASVIEGCIYEVEQYLFGDKFAVKKLQMDFNENNESEVTVTISDNEGNSTTLEVDKKGKLKKAKKIKVAEEAA